MRTKRSKILAAGFALLLAAPAAHAVEILNTPDAKLDLGARFQLQGQVEYSGTAAYVPVTYAAGNGNRDFTRIFLFQPENRLKLSGELDGMKFRFENAMGGEAFAGSNNLYDLLELNAEIPVTGHTSVVAGLSKLPNSAASASYEENLLFTNHSELFNLFFNMGYDNTLMFKAKYDNSDFLLGTSAGVPNLPQRYLPEGLMLPPPVYTRFGFGNIKDDPSHFKQEGFEKDGQTQWGVHVNGYYAADSNAGHGTLLGNYAAQAEAPKGPFVNGNMLLSKNYNPFLGFTSGPDGLARVYASFWNASVDSQLRLPVGSSYVVFGAQYSVAQYTNTYMNSVRPKINGVTYEYGQVTAQGAEFYSGYEGEKLALAGRLDVLLPDPMMMSKDATGYYNSIFGPDPVYELTFPAISYKLNKYAKLVAETKFTFNSPEAVDTDGIYQLTEVPIESSLATKKNPVVHEPVMGIGRLMLQVAF